MKKLRVGLIIVAFIIIIIDSTFIDFSDLTWSRNSGPYFGIIGMICVILLGIISFRYNKKSKVND